VALGSTEPLIEMGTRNISWGKGGQCVGLTTLPVRVDCLQILGASTSRSRKDFSRPVKGLLYNCYNVDYTAGSTHHISLHNKLKCRPFLVLSVSAVFSYALLFLLRTAFL